MVLLNDRKRIPYATIFIAAATILCGCGGEEVNDFLALHSDARIPTVFCDAVTYMFAHTNIIHLVVNVLILLAVGWLFEWRLGSRRFAMVYFVSGIVGAAVFIAVCRLANLQSVSLAGCSAAVSGVVAALLKGECAVIHIFKVAPIRAAILLLLILANVVGVFTINAGGAVAHLGGIAAGMVLMRKARHKCGKKRTNPVVDKLEQSGFASLDEHEKQTLFK